MVPADDVIPFIARGREEVFIGFKHDTFGAERDDRHRAANGIDDGFLLKRNLYAVRNIGSNFNHSGHPAPPVRYRDITGFQPYGTLPFCQTQIFTAKAFAAGKALPEVTVLR